jgi:hypothetical protein
VAVTVDHHQHQIGGLGELPKGHQALLDRGVHNEKISDSGI